MGRRTYESIGRPLPGTDDHRRHARNDWRRGAEHVLVAHGIPEALALASRGGRRGVRHRRREIYAETLPVADRIEITLVDPEPAGDTLFPAVDWSEWREVRREAGEGLAYITYERARN